MIWLMEWVERVDGEAAGKWKRSGQSGYKEGGTVWVKPSATGDQPCAPRPTARPYTKRKADYWVRRAASARELKEDRRESRADRV
jgi:hypothetical protein